MKDYYTNSEQYLMQIKLVKDLLDEVEKFAVWNEDLGLDEVVEMKIQLFRLENKIGLAAQALPKLGLNDPILMEELI